MNIKLVLAGIVSGLILAIIVVKTGFIDRCVSSPGICGGKAGTPILAQATYPYSLPKLTYDYKALEPHIDAKTLELHHTKHQQGAIDNLNEALKNFPEYHHTPLVELLKDMHKLPERLQQPIRDFGGSHFDHTLYFSGMTPTPKKPSGKCFDAIVKAFGSFNNFQDTFNAIAKKLVGSGWVWLCLEKGNKLNIVTSPNYDVPFADDCYPLLVLDVWEHAYYLKYQNQRINYIKAWWHVVNWEHVEQLYRHGYRE